MELRQLEYFAQVSQLRSISRAAAKLHVSQPNISVSIQKLERELGIELFDRTEKQLALTPEGTSFYNHVKQALAILQEAAAEINDYNQLRKGFIKIGIPPMISIYLFPKVFFDFQKAYPHLELLMCEEGSLCIRDMLGEKELDLGIISLADMPSDLDIIILSTRQIVVCLPRNHPLCQKDSIEMEDLKDQPLILLKEKTLHRKVILERCARHNFTPHVILSSNQITAIKNMVANGAGISFLFDAIVENDPDIEGRPLADPIFVDIGLAWNKNRYLSKAARTFIEFIKIYFNPTGVK